MLMELAGKGKQLKAAPAPKASSRQQMLMEIAGKGKQLKAAARACRGRALES